ncbi:MAG: MXAN_2562 family outer membrane beta-barrel protein [Myxococcota bacterium]
MSGWFLIGVGLTLGQFQTGNPSLTLNTVLRPEARLVGLNDLVGDNDAPIELAWTGTHGSGFLYEVTYDSARTEANPSQPLVLLDETQSFGENRDTSISGQRTFIEIRPSQIVAAPEGVTIGDIDPETGIILVNDLERSIVIRVFPSGEPTAEPPRAATASYVFTIDTIPPPPPEVAFVSPGENRLVVEMSVTEDGLIDTREQNFLDVAFCKTDTATVGQGDIDAFNALDEDDRSLDAFVDVCGDNPVFLDEGFSGTVDEIPVEDLTNGVATLLAVRAEDSLENQGGFSPIFVETPVPVTDFFELFNEQGGEETGGFCFIATAAYGSYAHPVVRVLRGFRDAVLNRSLLGTGLIRAYYRLGPAWTEELDQHPWAKRTVRFMLLGVAIFAGSAVLVPLGALLAMVGLASIRWFRRRLGWGVLVFLASNGLGSEAWAQQITRGRTAAPTRPEPSLPIGLGFEFKGGPYRPALADDPAFQEIFGDDSGGGLSTALASFGTELQLFRGFGSAGLYGSVSFTRYSGSGLFEDGTASNDNTALNILPVTAQLFYRADFIVDRTPVPLAPYVRGGFASYFWWTTDGSGDISRAENGTPSDEGDDAIGRGSVIGLTGTVGLSILLNGIDRNATRDLFNATRVRGTYIFAELVASNIDDFGGAGFDFSDVTFNAGLFIEL